MKIVLIEDEKLTAKDLKKTLQEIDPDNEVVAMLHSVEEGIDYFKTNPEVDLIFSDIQLGDGLSFQIFEATNNQIPIIFSTAFNEYALDAFKTMGIDYLLKPFSSETVSKALEKFTHLRNSAKPTLNEKSSLLKILENTLVRKIPSIIIHQGAKIIPIEGSSIALFVIENENTYAITFDQKKYLVSEKLEILEELFTPNFFRANRQYLVNRKAIKDASHSFNRKITVNLTIPFKEQILIGKLKASAFLSWLA